MSGRCRFDGEEPVRRNTADHHLLPLDAHQVSNSVAEVGAPAAATAADVLQSDSDLSCGAAPPACLTEDKPQTAEDPAVMDDGNNMDILPVSTQKWDAMQSGESAESQQLMLHPPSDQADTERQDRPGVDVSSQTPAAVENKEQKTLYQSVLRQMQQQQKHKVGRKFKKKTLMKMAKLFVISRGWESDEMQVNCSTEEDIFTSVSLVTSDCGTSKTKSLKAGKDDCDKGTVFSTVSRDAETDCSSSTKVLDESGPAEKKRKSRKLSSEDSTIPCEASGIIPAEVFGGDAPEKQRKKTNGSMVGVKHRTKRKPLSQTYTEFNNEMTQDVREGVLVSHNEPLPPSVQDTIVHAAQQNHETSESASSLQNETSPVETVKPAAPARKIIRKRRGKKDPGLTDGNNDLDSVLSHDSIDTTLPGQTANLKKRKTTSKKHAKKGSKLSGASETDGSKSMEMSSEEAKISCEESRNVTAEIPSVDAPKKQALKPRKKRKGFKLCVKKRTKQKPLAQTFTEWNNVLTQNVSEGFLESHNELLADTSGSSVQDTVFNGMDLNSPKQEHDESELLTPRALSFQGELSPVETVPSAAPARKTIRKRKRMNKTRWADGENDNDLKTVLSPVPTDTFSAQTAAPLESKTTSIQQESQFNSTDCSASTKELDKADAAQESPVTASEMKRKSRKMGSDEAKISCEVSGILPAELPSAEGPKKPTFKQRRKRKGSNAGVKKRTKQKALPQTFTDCHDVMTQDVLNSEPQLAHSSSIQDADFHGTDLNSAQQQHDKSEPSALTSEAASSVQGEIGTMESVPARKTIRKRQRGIATGWADGEQDRSKETVFSHVSMDRFLGQTATAETGGGTFTDPLDKSDVESLYPRPVTVSKRKGKLRKISSEGTKITCEESRNITAETLPKKQVVKQRKKKKGSKLTVKKRTKQIPLAQIFTEYNNGMTCSVSEGVSVSHNEPPPVYNASIQDASVYGTDLNAAKQKHAESATSELTSEAAFQDEICPVESLPSAAPARKSRKSRRGSKAGWADGKNDCVPSTVSNDTTVVYEQTAMLAKKKTSYTRKKQAQEEAKLSVAAENNGSTLTDVLNEPAQEDLYSKSVIASKRKGKSRKISSEDAKITCEESRNITAETLPKKQVVKQRKKKKGSKLTVKKRTKQIPLAQIFTEYNNGMTRSVSEGVPVSHNEPPPVYNASIQDASVYGTDLNAAKQKHAESATSELTSEAAFQDEICPVESLPSAASARKSRKSRRGSKAGWADRKNDCVPSTVSNDTTVVYEQTAILAKKKTSYTRKKQAQEEAKLSVAAENNGSALTNVLNESAQEDLYSKSVIASKMKGKSRKISSEDAKITCDNGELSHVISAEVSSVKPRRKRKGSKFSVTKRTKQKPSPQTLTEHNDVMTQDVSEGVSEPLLACNGSSSEQEHQHSAMSGLTLDAASSFESVPPAVPAGKTLRKRRGRVNTSWAAKKKSKRSHVGAHCGDPANVGVGARNSESGGEMIDLKLKDGQEEQKRAARSLKVKIKLSYLQPKNTRRHERKSQKPLQCFFCGRSFRHITALTVHRRIHRGEKPYRCPTCGKRFAQLSALNAHSKIHTEPPAVPCPCCGATFKSKDELIVHFRVHTDHIHLSREPDVKNRQGGNDLSKPFKCSVCLAAFLSRAALNVHRRTHGGRPYTCSVCRKTFRKSSSLSSHERTHWPVEPCSCSVCCKSFVKPQELKRHSETHSGAAPLSCARWEQGQTQSVTDGFLVSQSVGGHIVTPTYFKCAICKQLHRHWCHYVLHLQMHAHGKSDACETCRHNNQTAEMRSHCIVCCRNSGEERACGSALTHIWKEPEAPVSPVAEPRLDDGNVPSDVRYTSLQKSDVPQVETGEEEVTDMHSPPPSPSCSSLSVIDDFDVGRAPSPKFASDQVSPKPSRLQSFIQRHCGRHSCGRCGKSFSHWNKLWLHRRLHPQTAKAPFSCSQCQLEFRFMGSYVDHLQEHAAQRQHACPLCPDTFADVQDLSSHISECHRQRDTMKCSTCGKTFSTLRNLNKHRLLHKGTSSHFCLQCDVSFSSNSALKTHLKTHGTRLKVPQPSRPVEPLLFPYHCRKCSSKFSSTDLLQAHQVCHFTAGGKLKSPSAVPSIPSRAPEDTWGVQPKRCLPVSNKKYLFRYPHPDRLYIVPVICSEPPAVISDSEDERQEIHVQSPPITTSASSGLSDFPQGQPAARLNSTPEDVGDICGGDPAEPSLMFSEQKELAVDVHSCAMCKKTFTDVSKLHEHYMDHARGDVDAESG